VRRVHVSLVLVVLLYICGYNDDGVIFKKIPKRVLSVDELYAGVRAGDRVVLGQAITLIESQLGTQQMLAHALIERCLPYTKGAYRVGITGTPGVGKSTFIEALGMLLIEKGHRVAVLAIDPSSTVHKGSILGDKTRMNTLSTHEAAFVRPSPAGATLGGVARKTRETIYLCEAAGFDVILVETVGVGQSEIAVHEMTDFFMLLLQPGAGDELQGIKRGVVEIADLVVINKADGDNIDKAKIAQRAYLQSLHLFPPKPSQWQPTVVTCSAVERSGIAAVWAQVEQYTALTKQNGYRYEQRGKQAVYWFREAIRHELEALFYGNKQVETAIQAVEQQIANESVSPFSQAQHLLQRFLEDVGTSPPTP
jgi:LAO/AO transport system kinase